MDGVHEMVVRFNVVFSVLALEGWIEDLEFATVMVVVVNSAQRIRGKLGSIVGEGVACTLIWPRRRESEKGVVSLDTVLMMIPISLSTVIPVGESSTVTNCMVTLVQLLEIREVLIDSGATLTSILRVVSRGRIAKITSRSTSDEPVDLLGLYMMDAV